MDTYHSLTTHNTLNSTPRLPPELFYHIIPYLDLKTLWTCRRANGFLKLLAEKYALQWLLNGVDKVCLVDVDVVSIVNWGRDESGVGDEVRERASSDTETDTAAVNTPTAPIEDLTIPLLQEQENTPQQQPIRSRRKKPLTKSLVLRTIQDPAKTLESPPSPISAHRVSFSDTCTLKRLLNQKFTELKEYQRMITTVKNHLVDAERYYQELLRDANVYEERRQFFINREAELTKSLEQEQENVRQKSIEAGVMDIDAPVPSDTSSERLSKECRAHFIMIETLLGKLNILLTRIKGTIRDLKTQYADGQFQLKRQLKDTMELLMDHRDEFGVICIEKDGDDDHELGTIGIRLPNYCYSGLHTPVSAVNDSDNDTSHIMTKFRLRDFIPEDIVVSPDMDLSSVELLKTVSLDLPNDMKCHLTYHVISPGIANNRDLQAGSRWLAITNVEMDVAISPAVQFACS